MPPAAISHRPPHIRWFFPSIGSWFHYGLGSVNDNLPQFIVLEEVLAIAAAELARMAPAILDPSTPVCR